MADQVQLSAGGSSEIPLDYVVPNAQQMTPVAVIATFDGTGAAGPFLPCVQIFSDSNQWVAQTFPSTPVAVGDSAKVTFAPFLRSDQAAAAAGELMWPSEYNIPLFAGRTELDSTRFGVEVIDNLSTHNARLCASSNGINDNGSQGAYFAVHLRLGPQHSKWSVDLVSTTGPDHGRLSFDWGSMTDVNGVLQDSTTVSMVGYPTLLSLFTAAFTRNVEFAGLSQFTLDGAPGATLTAFTGGSADGGPGMYHFRVRVIDKLAASTGFRATLSELRIRRLDAIGL